MRPKRRPRCLRLRKICGFSRDMCTKKQTGFRIRIRIRTRRLGLGLTLEDVCQRVSGLSVSRLSNWEHGRNMISVDEAKKLALVLEISAAYILTVEADPLVKTELFLLEHFRSADARGQKNILRTARDESGSSSVITDTPTP